MFKVKPILKQNWNLKNFFFKRGFKCGNKAKQKKLHLPQVRYSIDHVQIKIR